MLRLWDLRTGKALGVLEGHEEAVRAIALSADGRFALSGAQDKTVRLWGLEASRCLWRGTTTGWALATALSADGRWAAAGTYDRKVVVWDLDWGRGPEGA
jgi:WD40 repeat protein